MVATFVDQNTLRGEVDGSASLKKLGPQERELSKIIRIYADRHVLSISYHRG